MSTRSIKDLAPKINIISLEQQVHILINNQRIAYGLHFLKFDPTLTIIARKHSMDMSQNNYFSHTNLAGDSPTERGKIAGFSCGKNFGNYLTDGIAENISQSFLYNAVTYLNHNPHYHWNTVDSIAKSTVKGWMKSPGHRKNILKQTYESEGIGAAISEEGKVFVTQNFF